MRHKFHPSAWNAVICGQPGCLRKQKDHHCEACNSPSEDVTLISKMLLCDECLERHKAASQKTDEAIKKDTERKLSLEQIVNQVNRLVDEESPIKAMDGNNIFSIIDNAIKGNIKQYTDFFNARIPAIVELKETIYKNPELKTEDDKRYALALVLRARVMYLSRVLFQFNAKEIEVGAEIKSIQEYCSKLIPQVRAELRAKYQELAPQYNPPVSEVKTPKVRMTAEDKMAENYAKMMSIPIEKARMLLKGKLKEINTVCTCSATPGICKLHAAR